MVKIKLSIPEQFFILEGKNLQEARDSFDAANINFYDEEIEEKTKSKLYVCPNEDCNYETYWTFDDIASKGEPVCPKCDEDLEQGCSICHKSEDADGRCGCTNKDAYGI